MEGVRRILNFDKFKPRIFAGRLIKVAVNANKTLHTPRVRWRQRMEYNSHTGPLK
jgi:hypothetical protein